ncbi:MAG: membrane protein insertion efficiency factor YidD [Chitinivibrionales bacterium]|nr:membrane protein insertion efficiency factor YidD [Chitinivibrionales bacterium]
MVIARHGFAGMGSVFERAGLFHFSLKLITISDVVRSGLAGLGIMAMTLCSTAGEQDGWNTEEIAFVCSLSVGADNDEIPTADTMVSDRPTSEFQMISYFLIDCYQKYISSQQQGTVCVFTPSCSNFGVEAIRRFGFVQGIALTSDRLTRCSPYARHYDYAVNHANGRLYDPVEYYGALKLVNHNASATEELHR